MKYTVQARRDVITEDTTIRDNVFGGWKAINTGNTVVSVLGCPIQPGEEQDYTNLDPDVIWTSPIQFIVNGGEVTLIRLMYSKGKEA